MLDCSTTIAQLFNCLIKEFHTNGFCSRTCLIKKGFAQFDFCCMQNLQQSNCLHEQESPVSAAGKKLIPCYYETAAITVMYVLFIPVHVVTLDRLFLLL